VFAIATLGCGDYDNFGKKHLLKKDNSYKTPIHVQTLDESGADNMRTTRFRQL
jgi:hypothetical protein